MFRQKLNHRFATPHAVSGDQNPSAECAGKSAKLRQRIGGTPVNLYGGQRQGGPKDVIAVKPGERLHPAIQLIDREKNIFRWQQRAVFIAAHQLEAGLRVFPEIFRVGCHVAMQKHAGVFRQIVENRGGTFKKQWQIIFNTVRCQACGDILVHAALRGITFEAVTEVFTETMLPVLVERKFTCRQQANLVDGINAALRVDVESADLIDFIAEQVDAIWHRAAHRKEIDQTASYSELARCHYLCRVGIAGQGEIATEAFKIEPRFDPDKKRMPGEILARAQTRHRGGNRHNSYVKLALRKVIERRETL